MLAAKEILSITMHWLLGAGQLQAPALAETPLAYRPEKDDLVPRPRRSFEARVLIPCYLAVETAVTLAVFRQKGEVVFEQQLTGRDGPSIVLQRFEPYCLRVKIYISADMEGVAGIVTDAQLGPDGFGFQEACELYTDEVLAVIDELRSAGATDITVSDSHGTGLNLKIDRLPAGVRLVQAWPRRLGMMEGIDASYDGAILLGYHSGSHNPRGVRAHTMSSANIFDVSLNGQTVCEAELSAYIAAHFQVPILMISGDDAVCEEIANSLPDCEPAVVKRAISYHSADSLSPADARDVLRAATRRALVRRTKIKIRPLVGAVTMDITFKNHRPTELLAYLPNVAQLDAHRVRFVAKDILEASSFFEFALNYSPDLKP